MSVLNSFATRLKELREEKQLNQGKLANDLGISRGSISFYENGDRKPDIEILDRISKYFDVPVDYLLGYTDIRRKENVNMGKELGLSDVVINQLKEWNGVEEDITVLNFHREFNGSKMINELMSDGDMIEFLTAISFFQETCKIKNNYYNSGTFFSNIDDYEREKLNKQILQKFNGVYEISSIDDKISTHVFRIQNIAGEMSKKYIKKLYPNLHI